MAETKGKFHGWNAAAVVLIICAPVLLFAAEFVIRDSWCHRQQQTVDQIKKLEASKAAVPVPAPYKELLSIPQVESCNPHEFFAPTCLAAAIALLLSCLIYPDKPESETAVCPPAPKFAATSRWAHEYRDWLTTTRTLRRQIRTVKYAYRTDKALVYVSGVAGGVACLAWLTAVLAGLSGYDVLSRFGGPSTDVAAAWFYGLACAFTILKFKVMQ